jgi:hypothetical protein
MHLAQVVDGRRRDFRRIGTEQVVDVGTGHPISSCSTIH